MKLSLGFCLLLLLSWASVAAPRPEAPRTAAESDILSAESAIARDDDQLAERALSRLPAGALDPVQLARVQIVRAQIGLRRNQPEVVLRALPVSAAHVPQLALRIEQLRARALFDSGDPVGAVRSLIERERWITDAGTLAENRELIWRGLLATPLSPSAEARIAPLEPRARGWLDLARVLQHGPTEQALAAWSARNPGHAAADKAALVRSSSTLAPPQTQAPTLAPPLSPDSAPGGGYALLLPLTGSLAVSGRAVREGFIAAWYELPEPRLPVRVYDAGSGPAQTVSAARTAIADGAGFLIGPLTKDGVTALASAGTGGRPWLALNQLDQPLSGGLQFGLAPEDEARAAARAAVQDGRGYALVLTPDNDWGLRVAAAFETELRAQGGQVLESLRYASGTQDFSKPLKNLMNLDQSDARHHALVTALGVPSEFEPRPRGDAQLLFAPMRPTEARVLMPQLEFFRAQRLPVYAPAAALAGGNGSDLKELHLCDMPWMLARNGPIAVARNEARAVFSDSLREQPRLYALGADALAVARAWQSGELAQGREIEGLSGRLRLDAGLGGGGRIARALDCAVLP